MKPIGSSAGGGGKKSRYTSLEARDETTHPSWTLAPAIYSARTCSQVLHTRPCDRYHRGYRQGARAVSGGSRVPEHPHPKRGERSLTQEPLHGAHSLRILHHLGKDLEVLRALQGPCGHRLGPQGLGHTAGGDKSRGAGKSW